MRRTWTMSSGVLAMLLLAACGGCNNHEPTWGREQGKVLSSARRQVWAVAPVINMSGERGVDSILQADLLYQQLQQVRGLTVIPVNKVAEVYVGLRIDRVASPEQAALVCDLLGCDGLVIGSVTIYDPYNPPKLGAALQVFLKPRGYARPAEVDPRELVRRATAPAAPLPDANGALVQSVGMFDAANGSVRERLSQYAAGRHDPVGPLGEKEYLVSMDRYSGFVWSELIDPVIANPKVKGP